MMWMKVPYLFKGEKMGKKKEKEIEKNFISAKAVYDNIIQACDRLSETIKDFSNALHKFIEELYQE